MKLQVAALRSSAVKTLKQARTLDSPQLLLVLLVPAAPPGVDPAEEVRACRAEGPAAHDETLRARADRRPQEGRADPSSGALNTHQRRTVAAGHLQRHRTVASAPVGVMHSNTLTFLVRPAGSDPPACDRREDEPVDGAALQSAQRGQRHPEPSLYVSKRLPDAQFGFIVL